MKTNDKAIIETIETVNTDRKNTVVATRLLLGSGIASSKRKVDIAPTIVTIATKTPANPKFSGLYNLVKIGAATKIRTCANAVPFSRSKMFRAYSLCESRFFISVALIVRTLITDHAIHVCNFKHIVLGQR